MSLVIAARPGRSGRIGRSADGQQQQEADERHRVVLDGQHPQAVRQLPPAMSGNLNVGSGRVTAGANGRPSSRHRHRLRAVERQRRLAGGNDAEHDARLRPQPRA